MPRPDPADFFANPKHPDHIRYEILRVFYVEGLSAEAIARRFDVDPETVHAMAREFRTLEDPAADIFLPPDPRGRPPKEVSPALRERILILRDLQLSVSEIKAQLNADGMDALGEHVIKRILREAGRPRLPRRTNAQRAAALAAAAAGGNQGRSDRKRDVGSKRR